MWEKEKYYRLILKKIIIFTLNASIIWLLSSKIVFAEIAFAAEIFANKAASMGLWEAK